MEFIEFDPAVDPKDSWKAPSTITLFLEKHFNRSLLDDEREAIMKDFPRPHCDVLSTPKIDDDLKEQLKSRGKDPHFGAEKSLYKIQDQLMDVTAPLTYLWADLLNNEAERSPEDVLLLIQRTFKLVLVGSTSHAINVERRRIAWSRLNPKLKSLVSEDYEKRETNLFGPGFLEKASKRLEVDKTLAKVTSQPSTSQKTGGYSKNAKAKSLDYGKEDLHSSLDKGASAWHMGAGTTGAHNHARTKERAPKGRFTSTITASPRQPATLPRESEQIPHASTLEYTLNYFTWSGRPAPSGSHTTLHGKLAEADKRPLGAGCGKGVSFGSRAMAFPAGTSESQRVEQEGPGISSDRSREDATERCYL